MSGGAWLTGDVATKDRMNAKTLLVDTGANIAALGEFHSMKYAICTATGSGFVKHRHYQWDPDFFGWVDVGGFTPLLRELGRATLGGTADTLTVSNIPACDSLLVLIRKESTTASDVRLQFNGDTGASYANRESADGGADATNVSQNQIDITQNNNTLPSFSVVEISNRAGEEKIVTALDVTQNTAGDATAPGRGEVVGKWANEADRISSITITNAAAGDYASGTEIVVIGLSSDEALTEFWVELGSTTLGSAGDNLDVTSFAARKYLMIEAHLIASGNIGGLMTFNNDGGSNYAQRSSADGAADVTSTSRTTIALLSTAAVAHDVFVMMFVINTSTHEKLVIFHSWRPNAAGAGSAPTKLELVGKWVNTTNQITRVDINNNGSGDFATGSTLKIWGSN